MKRQKFLPACKAVSSRDSQLKSLLEVPLEVVGNDDPRQMTAPDRIRLTMQQKDLARGLFVHDIIATMRYLVHSEIVARWSVYLLFALVPFFFIPVPWVSVVQSKTLLATVLVVVGFLAWITSSLNVSKLRFPKSPLLITAFLVPLAYLISALATGASWNSFLGYGGGQDTVVGFTIWYVALFISALILGEHYVRSVIALRLFLLGSSIVLLVQIIHLILPTFSFGGVLSPVASSIIGSWHDLGIFLGLVVFMSLSLLRTSVAGRYWYGGLLAIVLASLFLLIIINYSDVWLGIFFLGLVSTLFLYRFGAPGSSASRLRALLPWVVLAAAALGLYFGGDRVHAVLPPSLQVTQLEVRPSWKGTLAVGQGVFAEPAQIFFGSGPNTFPREWGLYKPISVNATQFWNTDFYYGVGFIPTSFVTTGVMGLLAWGAVCGALVWSVFRSLRQTSGVSLVRATLMGSALYLTIFHVLYVPGPALSLLTFLLFGLLIAEEISAGSIREWSLSLLWGTWQGKAAVLALSLCGFMVFVGGVQSVRALISDVLVDRAAVKYSATQDLQAASRSISLAVNVLPQNDRAHRAGVELGLLQLARLAGAADASDASRAELQRTLTATIDHGLAAVSIQSRDYQNWLTLARLYGELAGVGVEGAEERARDAYAEAQKNNPTSPLPYLGEAQLDLIKGNDTAARKDLEAALLIKPDLAPAHFLLSQVYARTNDLKKAEEHAGATVQIAPEDPLGWYNLGTIFYAGGNSGNAALALERAVALQNNYANALFLLGLSYYRLDRKDDALKALRAVALLNPADAGLAEVIKKVETGQGLGASFR